MTGGTAAWLAELARPASGPVPWARMAHAALAVCVPLGLGIALGQPVPGLLAGMGGLLAVVVDPGGPYPLRARRIAAAATAGAAAGLLVGGRTHGGGWVAVVVLVAVAGVSALLSAAGNVASVTGLRCSCTASWPPGRSARSTHGGSRPPACSPARPGAWRCSPRPG